MKNTLPRKKWGIGVEKLYQRQNLRRYEKLEQTILLNSVRRFWRPSMWKSNLLKVYTMSLEPSIRSVHINNHFLQIYDHLKNESLRNFVPDAVLSIVEQNHHDL